MTQLALVIDLNVCVGCHACVTSCKQWNTSGTAGALTDLNPYGADPNGTFFNRVQTFEVGEFPITQTVHFPKSCLHCEDPPCVPVCPTGASYKRAEDGIVLVDYDKCIGCKYCTWACPYGAREFDEQRKVMTKCTLCVDRVTDTALPERERKPACVLACPSNARLFGDVHDPESVVSQAIAERGGVLGAIIVGFRRAAFSNEAGLGSAAIAHSAVRTREPVKYTTNALVMQGRLHVLAQDPTGLFYRMSDAIAVR